MTAVARHIGRLGNNMFQISAALGYAKKYGYQWGVDPGRGQGEPFSSIHESFPHLPKVESLSGVRYHDHPSGICPQHGVNYDLCHYDYHEIPDMGPSVVFTGFWQSWKYFDHCKEEVKKVFALPHVAGYEDYVSIHVRRGDYVQGSRNFEPVEDQYILHATYMAHHLGIGGKYVVFSDDIEWCKDYFKKFHSEIIFSEGKPDLDDLSLMSSCGHHIIANSSFSWWAAYLGHNPDRIVICPSAKRGNWYGLDNGIKQDVVDLLPPEWHQIIFR